MAEAPDSKNILAGAKYSPQQNGSGNETTAPAPQASEILLRGSQYNAEDLHPLARVHKGELDYLLLDEAALNEMEGARSVLPSRGWSDELCYGTGTMYLSGLAAGGVWGMREGLAPRSKPSVIGAAAEALAEGARTQARTSMRLRWNTVLNAVTRRGSFMGNHAGVLALMYNMVNATLDQYRGRHDMAGSMAAGAVAGALWKSTAGIRAASIAATGLAGLAGVWTVVKRTVL